MALCTNPDCRSHGKTNRLILSMGEELDDLYVENARLKLYVSQLEEVVQMYGVPLPTERDQM